MLDFLKHYWTLSRKNKAELVLITIAIGAVLAALITIFIKVPALLIPLVGFFLIFALIQIGIDLEYAYKDWKRKNPHR